MNNVKILRYLATTLSILGLSLGASAATVVPETTSAPFVQQGTGNDTYLIVQNVPGNGSQGVPPFQALPPAFCPYGYGWDNELGCSNRDWGLKQHQPVTPQQAVDLAYGQNKGIAIGVIPFNSDQSTILVKAVQSKPQ